MRLHSASLLKAVERRQWSKVDGMLAESYADRWEHDKAFVLSGLREAFGGFVFLTLEHRVVALDLASGHVVEQVKISGQGNVIAQFVMAKVNGLADPFTFTWRKRPGGPWAWELVRVDHPTLDPGEPPQFWAG